jgi:TPR repeat protein
VRWCIRSLPLLSLSLVRCAASTLAPLHIPPPPEPPSPVVRAPEAPFDLEESQRFSRETVACSGGDNDACLSLADRFIHGRGAVGDNRRARSILEPLCASSVPRACAALAGLDVWATLPETAVHGRSLAQRECSSGQHDACVSLADARSLGLGGPIERDRVEPLLRASCSAAHHPACAALALWLVDHGRVDESTAISQAECARSEPRACLAAALSSPDQRAADALTERACQLGSARACAAAARRARDAHQLDRAHALFQRACFALVPAAGCADWLDAEPDRFNDVTRSLLAERACLFERDPAVCSRFVRAALVEHEFSLIAPVHSWLAVACDADDPVACSTFAAVLLRERRDDPRIEPWLRASCARRDVFACARLGDWLSLYAPRNESLDAWRRACDQGEVAACRSLASALVERRSHGESPTPARLALAYPWAARGCALRDAQCCLVALYAAQNHREREPVARAACALGLLQHCAVSQR